MFLSMCVTILKYAHVYTIITSVSIGNGLPETMLTVISISYRFFTDTIKIRFNILYNVI